ncbi:MAG: HAD family hydrolase [Desulfurococcus sp.]|jgi:phosphoglycolate phosphatase|uniref:HAD family hydrolase n=1 Tax=Desulfurococcus sp. TaxID=51678 RepID=UPI0031660C83
MKILVSSLLNGVRLILFDLDGTLVDSEDFIVWSFTEAARLTGLRVDPSIIRELIGYPLEYLLNEILGGVSGEKAREFIEVRRRLVWENWSKHVKLFPDVVPTLEYLSSKGYMLGVASSSIVERINAFLNHLGVSRYFNVVSGVTPGVRGKPEPDVILNALRMTGMHPGETLYIGDRVVDCIAARRAGVRIVIVNRRGTGLPASGCSPDAVVQSLMELIE